MEKQMLHAFETGSGAHTFAKVTGEERDNIVIDGVGWRLGRILPTNATVYLWPSTLGEAAFKWIDEIAATTKATLKWPTVPAPYREINDWIRAGATADHLLKAMVEAETVPNTNEPTDYDLLVELKRKADAMSEEEFQSAMRQNEINVFASRTKYHSDEELIHELADRSPIEYERLRDYAVKRLNCRTPVLDKEVERYRKPAQIEKPAVVERVRKDDSKLQGSLVLCPDVEP
jgi:hypothetical protein